MMKALRTISHQNDDVAVAYCHGDRFFRGVGSHAGCGQDQAFLAAAL